ncbi:MAG: cation diffusion facilitator family transporter [Candidatus Thorarchaeota archaeon]|nr:cation diffusion facilitator family transporter [Candidatus Thorarchaeota archaeon]
MKKNTAAFIAIIGGLIVFSIKIIAYFISNSVALLSDALESIVNILASGMMILSIYISEKPADDTHKYGHQKVEDISSAFEGILIIIAALLIVNAAAGRLFVTVELFEINLAIAISVLATGINAGISILLTRTAKSSGSMALEGDAKHLLSDVISTVGIWIGLVIVQITGWQFMDALLAFVVAILITRMGLGLIVRSLRRLMDHSCVEEEKTILSVLDEHHSDFIEFHDLKSRRQGNFVLAEIHLTVQDSMSVRMAHDIIDQIEKDLKEEASHIRLSVHIDPETEL